MVWNISFFHIYIYIIIPTEHFFQRGWSHQPDIEWNGYIWKSIATIATMSTFPCNTTGLGAVSSCEVQQFSDVANPFPFIVNTPYIVPSMWLHPLLNHGFWQVFQIRLGDGLHLMLLVSFIPIQAHLISMFWCFNPEIKLCDYGDLMGFNGDLLISWLVEFHWSPSSSPGSDTPLDWGSFVNCRIQWSGPFASWPKNAGRKLNNDPARMLLSAYEVLITFVSFS